MLVYLTVSFQSYKLTKFWSVPFYPNPRTTVVPKFGEYREIPTSAYALGRKWPITVMLQVT